MILNITAYFIIPVYTFLFAWGTDLFRLNFSVLGSLANRKNAFLLWGIIVGIYFYYVLRKIIHHLPRNRKETVTSVSALILLAFAVTTPYLPENRPFRAFLHVIFAFSASVLLLACSLPDRVEALLHEPGSIPSLLHLSEHHHCAVGHALVSGRNRQQRAGNILYRILYSDAHQTVPSCFIVQGRLLQSEAQSLKTPQAACRYSI